MNKTQTLSHDQQTQLAKLLAMENIDVQHDSEVSTAAFDVGQRLLILPTWNEMSRDLYDMLVVHEVGHALDTPATFMYDIEEMADRLKANKSVLKDFLNVIEDARIDKRQKRRYPGARRNYIKGYAELFEKNFFGTENRDINAMSFIDRINIHFKSGINAKVKFSPAERDLIKLIEAAETYQDVLDLTEKVYLFTKENLLTVRFGELGFTDGEATGKSKSDASSSPSFPFFAPESDEDEDEDEDFDDDGVLPPPSTGRRPDYNNGTYANPNREVAAPETEQNWQKNQYKLVANKKVKYIYVNIPNVKNYISSVIDDYKIVHAEMNAARSNLSSEWLTSNRQELQKFKNAEAATISYMVKEFETHKAADEYRRTSISKTGVLNTNKLHSYQFNDDIFRRIATVSEGKSHGFVMFLDWSGSMSGTLTDTMKQLFLLVMFCKRINVPFEVYSFRTFNNNEKGFNTLNYANKEHDLLLSKFKLRNILSSRMKLAELNNAMANLWAFASGGHFPCDKMGSTPLNEAIIFAEEIVNEFKRNTKVQVINTVFLTDGGADGNDLVTTPPGKYWNIPSNFIIKDEKTKRTYDFGFSNYGGFRGGGDQLTSVLLKSLKERTDCNLIGFYIDHSSFIYTYNKFFQSKNPEHQAETKKFFDTNGFIGVTNAGYDEYYILKGTAMAKRENEMKIDSNMTKGKIAKAFMSFANKKFTNRVLAQRIVKRISS